MNLVKEFELVLGALLGFLLIGLSQDASQVLAQNIKGGSPLKGGPSFSRFRENIATLQRQIIAPKPVANFVSTSQEQSSSFSSTQQQPLAQQVLSNKFESTNFQQTEQQTTDSEPFVYGAVKGTAGVDFPAYSSIPNTEFSCQGLPFDPGMYADESTGCQVYHLCYQGRRESFLCGIGTIFNQAILGCDFWYSVDCSKSSQFYQANAEFGKASAEPKQKIQLQQQSLRRDSLIRRPAIQQQAVFVSEEEQSTGYDLVTPAQPPTVQQTSFASSTSSGSNSLPLGSFGGKTSARRVSSQRPSGSLSFNQRRLQTASSQQQQFAAESSMRVKLAKTDAAGQAGLETNTVGVSAEDSATGPVSSGQSSFKVKEQPGDNDPWKPYFKSKQSPPKQQASGEKPPSSVSLSPPVQNISKAPTSPTPTTPSEQTPTSEAPSGTAEAQPNQEPSFSSSGDGESSSGSSSNEKPNVPKSQPPPPAAEGTPPSSPTSPPALTTALPTDGSDQSPSSAAIESDVGAAVTTTTPAPPADQPVATNTTATPPPENSAAEAKTEPSSEANSVEAPAAVSTEVPPALASEEASPASNGGESGTDQKKRRGTVAREENDTREDELGGKSAPSGATSSLVEYAVNSTAPRSSSISGAKSEIDQSARGQRPRKKKEKERTE